MNGKQHPEQKDVSANNSLIMLQTLVMEAARYQESQRQQFHNNNGLPAFPSSSSLDRSPTPNISFDANSSLGSTPTTPPGGSVSSRFPTYMTEEWLDLLDQVTYQYETCNATTNEERFHRAKCRLTPLFLWNPALDIDRGLYPDTQALLENIHRRHRERLSLIPEGKLFLD